MNDFEEHNNKMIGHLVQGLAATEKLSDYVEEGFKNQIENISLEI